MRPGGFNSLLFSEDTDPRRSRGDRNLPLSHLESKVTIHITFISLGASFWGSSLLLFVEFFSFFRFVLLLLCLGYLYSRSWLFDADMVYELVLVVFLIIRHLGLLGCGWFSPLALRCGGSVRGYTYVLLVSACCRSVLVLEVTHRLASW
jgi:hypothetical protein